MFTFNRGSWIDGSSLPEWQDNEGSDEYLRRIGYTSVRTLFGHPDGCHLEIYESSVDKSFYAIVCPSGDTCYEVFLPDFPSLMMFIRDHATAFSAESAYVAQQKTSDLLEKMFRVQHGHSAHNICPECDPDGWKAREQRLKKK